MLPKNKTEKKEYRRQYVWKSVIGFFISYSFVFGLFVLLGEFFSGYSFYPDNHKANSFEIMVLTGFGLLGSFLVLGLFMKKVDKEPFVNLGFRRTGITYDLVKGTLLGFFIMLAGSMVLVLLGQIQFVETTIDIQELVYTGILYLMVAILEETVFRGYILRNLLKVYSPISAILVSSVLFGMVHGFNANISWVGFINIFLSGLLMGLFYYRNRRLWLPIAFHFSWNFFQSIFGFHVSGNKSYSLVHWYRPENNVYNGGEFGFEGSILAIVIQVLLIGIVLYSVRKEVSLIVNKN